MNLIRQPDEWARDWGWISRRRAVNLAAKLESIAVAIEETLNDEGGEMYAREIRKVKKSLAPAKVPAERKRIKRDRVAAMREP